MTDTYRALCAELVEQLQRAINDYGFCLEANDALMHRTRAALAKQPVSTPYKLPEPVGPKPQGGKPFHWRNLGDGKPVQVQECPICGIAPANVDDCGRFGDPACLYFGVGEPQPVPAPDNTTREEI